MGIVYLLTALILAATASAQAFRWTTYTSTSSVNGMLAEDGRVWMATTGGLSAYSFSSGEFDVYTNTRGMAMNRVMAVGRDHRGWIWAGLFDGRITRLNPETGEIRQITDLQGEVFQISHILNVGEEVFVAADNGIYRFSYREIADNFRVFESINVIGNLPGETGVNRLAAHDGYLWAATQGGLARALLSEQTMSAPDAWETFRVQQGLPQNVVKSIYATEGGLWVATEDTVSRFASGLFLDRFPLGGIHTFSELSGLLHAANDFRVYRTTTGSPMGWQQIGDVVPHVTGLTAVTIDGEPVISATRADGSEGPGGLTFFVDGAWTAPIANPGIGANQIYCLGVGPDGDVWAGGLGATYGVYSYDGTAWANYHPATGFNQYFFQNQPLEMEFDNQGGVWVSTFGGGVMWRRTDGGITYFNLYDSTSFGPNGPRLIGVYNGRHFHVGRVTRNAIGDIFISSRNSDDFLTIARVPNEWIALGNNPGPWYYMLTGREALSDQEIEEILVDPFDRVWAGASQYGSYSYVIDDAGSRQDTTDDIRMRYIPQQHQDDQFTCYYDIGPWVLDMEIDQQNYIWFATTNGAYYTQGGVPSSVEQMRLICANLPVGNRVNDIHVDGQDNKWFATDEGVAVLDRNFVWVHIFRTAADADNPSDLPSDDVTAIASSSLTGDVWIGTSDGLARLESPYTSRDPDLDELKSYPSPFQADGSQRLFLDHQSLGGRFDELRIYTISGILVKELAWSEMIDPSGGWNGRNEDGNLVAGGIYLMVASAENGGTATGKIAVLGK